MSYQCEDARRAIAQGGGSVEAHYALAGGRTILARIHERGSLRIRQPKGRVCQSVLINTAGGVVAGDHISLNVSLHEGSNVTFTSAAAEKVYRGQDSSMASAITARMMLAPTSRLIWLPQETILFDRVQLRRTFMIDLAESAEVIAAELLVFGRQAYGENSIRGGLHDSWRVRRAGRLVLADETRLDGAIGEVLKRRAVAGGAFAVAFLIFASPRAAACLEPIRAVIATAAGSARSPSCEAGASLNDGIIVARILAASAERLRSVLAAMLTALDVAIPDIWR